MPNENARSDRYLIRKGAYFYRPIGCGYTVNKDEAGRYTRAQAEIYTYPNGPDGPRDDMSYIHEDDVPDTQAQHRERAAAAAAWLAAMEVAVCIVNETEFPANGGEAEHDACADFAGDVEAALRSTHPPADAAAALAEVVRKAKEEEREACALLVRASANAAMLSGKPVNPSDIHALAAAIRARAEGGAA